MRRFLFIVVLILGALAAVPASASASERMFVGFQDDPSFRWADDRTASLDAAARANVTVVRATVEWADVAPQRPANPADPFDPAYRFENVDELVRNTQQRGIETLLTIWGTPRWANEGKGKNRLPSRLSDLTAFSQALAAATPAATRATRTSASTRCGTSRTESSSWRRSSTAAAARSRRRCTRGCTALRTAA